MSALMNEKINDRKSLRFNDNMAVVMCVENRSVAALSRDCEGVEL